MKGNDEATAELSTWAVQAKPACSLTLSVLCWPGLGAHPVQVMEENNKRVLAPWRVLYPTTAWSYSSKVKQASRTGAGRAAEVE